MGLGDIKYLPVAIENTRMQAIQVKLDRLHPSDMHREGYGGQ